MPPHVPLAQQGDHSLAEKDIHSTLAHPLPENHLKHPRISRFQLQQPCPGTFIAGLPSPENITSLQPGQQF